MAKYRFIGNTRVGRKCNKVYDGESKVNDWCYPVSELAIKFPCQWELIEDNMEKLPEKWCIRMSSSEINDAVNSINLCNLGKRVWRDNDYYMNSYVHSNWQHETVKLSDYTEITFDDFKRLVLKENTMSEKKIIGYKIIKEFPTTDNRFVIGFVLNATKFGENGWGNVPEMAAKYPEFWEPVYEQSFPDIIINGHRGEFFNDYVQFGCAKIGQNLFMQANKLIIANFDCGISNRSIQSVTIGSGTFTKDQIKEIAEYYLTK